MPARMIVGGGIIAMISLAALSLYWNTERKTSYPRNFENAQKCSIYDYHHRCKAGDFLVATDNDFIQLPWLRLGPKTPDVSVMVEICGAEWFDDGHVIRDSNKKVEKYICRIRANINRGAVLAYLERLTAEHRLIEQKGAELDAKREEWNDLADAYCKDTVYKMEVCKGAVLFKFFIGFKGEKAFLSAMQTLEDIKAERVTGRPQNTIDKGN